MLQESKQPLVWLLVSSLPILKNNCNFTIRRRRLVSVKCLEYYLECFNETTEITITSLSIRSNSRYAAMVQISVRICNTEPSTRLTSLCKCCDVPRCFDRSSVPATAYEKYQWAVSSWCQSEFAHTEPSALLTSLNKCCNVPGGS